MRRLLAEFRDAGGDAIEVLSPVAHSGAVHGVRDAVPRVRRSRLVRLRLPRSRRKLDGPGRPAAAARRRRPRLAGLVAAPAPARNSMANRRTVFFISDRTGITAEMFGNSLLSQFEEFEFHRQTIPFVDTPERIEAAVRQVNETAAREEQAADRVQLDRRRDDERDRSGATPTRSRSTSSRSSSRRSRPSSRRRARMRRAARTASPTVTSTSRGWTRSTSRRRTTTAPTRAISRRRR